jgi:hypothetical protein
MAIIIHDASPVDPAMARASTPVSGCMELDSIDPSDSASTLATEPSPSSPTELASTVTGESVSTESRWPL